MHNARCKQVHTPAQSCRCAYARIDVLPLPVVCRVQVATCKRYVRFAGGEAQRPPLLGRLEARGVLFPVLVAHNAQKVRIEAEARALGALERERVMLLVRVSLWRGPNGMWT
jgi:hypothetical protein